MARVGMVAVLSGVALACAPPVDQSAAIEELMEADRAFARETSSDRADGWVRYFTEDAVMFQGGSLVSGREEIRIMMAPVFADTSFSLEWEPVQAHVSAGLDLGYTIGRWRSTRTRADAPDDVETGSYVTIWRRQSDGRWLAVLDIGNPDTGDPVPDN